jgi:hypothetical protein
MAVLISIKSEEWMGIAFTKRNNIFLMQIHFIPYVRPRFMYILVWNPSKFS